MQSKLTRERDPALAGLHVALLRERRRLGAAPAVPGTVDEVARTLSVRRGGHELVMNFAREERRIGVDGRELALATHDGVRLEDGHVVLPALAGALVR
jgi:hypothetical protein